MAFMAYIGNGQTHPERARIQHSSRAKGKKGFYNFISVYVTTRFVDGIYEIHGAKHPAANARTHPRIKLGT